MHWIQVYVESLNATQFIESLIYWVITMGTNVCSPCSTYQVWMAATA